MQTFHLLIISTRWQKSGSSQGFIHLVFTLEDAGMFEVDELQIGGVKITTVLCQITAGANEKSLNSEIEHKGHILALALSLIDTGLQMGVTISVFTPVRKHSY